MYTRILLTLCIVFALYTGFVYTHSDVSRDGKAPGPVAERGKLIWREKNCQSCHQVYGLGGYMGPDLTNVAAKGPAYMRAFIERGTARMPDFQLSDNETGELIAFLQWIDKSGHSRVPDSAVHWTGSYRIDP